MLYFIQNTIEGFDKGKLSVRKGRKTMGPLKRIARFPKNHGKLYTHTHSNFGMGFLLEIQ